MSRETRINGGVVLLPDNRMRIEGGTGFQVCADNATRRQINGIFRALDASSLPPVRGRFNATERAIHRLQRLSRAGNYIPAGGCEYAAALYAEISQVVNNTH